MPPKVVYSFNRKQNVLCIDNRASLRNGEEMDAEAVVVQGLIKSAEQKLVLYSDDNKSPVGNNSHHDWIAESGHEKKISDMAFSTYKEA